MKRQVTVIKRNLAGQETWRYTGWLTRQAENTLQVEARFNGPDSPFMGTVIRNGDPFIESYYTDRWYNIFEIHDQTGGTLKGWYCNIARPVVIESEEAISYVDLALDLWIAPDGTQTVLDEDEFAALDLDENSRKAAISALRELQVLFDQKKYPDSR